jgi:hypothetical protein
MKTFDEIEFAKGTMIHIQGMPFWLSKTTVDHGNAKNLAHLHLGRHLLNENKRFSFSTDSKAL